MCWLKSLAPIFAASILFVPLSSSVMAEPTGANIEAGQAEFIYTDQNTTEINQSTDKAVIGFDSFNLSQYDTVLIRQPSSHSILWAKDYQGQASQIYGDITANGQFWLSNAHGILVGKNAKIDTAGTLLTTSSMRNQDFMSGNYNFSIAGNPKASIINEGFISAKDNGLVGIVAPGVVNDGVIRARLGHVHLGSGNHFTVDLRGDGLFRFAPDNEVLEQVLDIRTGKPLKSLVSNNGDIIAPGGLIALSAVQTRLLLDSVVDNSGRLLAPTYEKTVGKVRFSTALPSQQRQHQEVPLQKVVVNGEIDISGKGENQSGGEIAILGEFIGMTKTVIDASGYKNGGLVFIGGDYLGGNASQEQKEELDIKSSSLSLGNAQFTALEDISINADSLNDGEGGQVIIWAEQNTLLSGDISARGGQNSGDGGFVETSGKNSLATTAKINVEAGKGEAGTYLLDPGNITVGETGPSIDFSNPYEPTSDITISATSIEDVLNSGGNVSLVTNQAHEATSSTTESVITFQTSVNKTAGGNATLSLYAGNKIEIQNGVEISSTSGKLNIFADTNYENGDNYGFFRTHENSLIETNGGSVEIRTEGALLEGKISSTGGDISIEDLTSNNDNLVTEIGVGGSTYTGDYLVNSGTGNITLKEEATLTLNNHALRSDGLINITATNTHLTGRSYIPKIIAKNADSLTINGNVYPSAALTGECDKDFGTCYIEYTEVSSGEETGGDTTNTAPTIGDSTAISDQTVTENQNFSYTTGVNAFNDDAGVANLTLTATGLPNGVTFTDNGNGTGTFSGTPTTSGNYRITLTATDEQGESVSRTFYINVDSAPTPPPTPTNTAPTATTRGIIVTYRAGEYFSYTTPINMFSDDGGVENLTLTVRNLQSWMTFIDNGDGTATISGTPPDTNTYRPTIIATDVGGLFVEKDVRFELDPTSPPPTPTDNPPTIGAATLGNKSAVEGESFDYTTSPYVFSDDNGVENLTITASGLPSGVSFTDNGNGTGRFSGSPSQAGSYTITLQATDANGGSVSRSFTIVVEAIYVPPTPTDNPPRASNLPTFTHTASVFGDVSLVVSKDYYSDDNGRNNLTLSLRDGFSPPDGTRVSISRDGSLVVSGTIRRAGTYFIPVEATDSNGQSVTRTFKIVFDPSSFEVVQEQKNIPDVPDVSIPEEEAPTPVIIPRGETDKQNPSTPQNEEIVSDQDEVVVNGTLDSEVGNNESNHLQQVLEIFPDFPEDEFQVWKNTQNITGTERDARNLFIKSVYYLRLQEDVSNSISPKTTLFRKAFAEAVIDTTEFGAGLIWGVGTEAISTLLLLYPPTWVELGNELGGAIYEINALRETHKISGYEVLQYLNSQIENAPAVAKETWDNATDFERGEITATALGYIFGGRGKQKSASKGIANAEKILTDLRSKLDSGTFHVNAQGKIVKNKVDNALDAGRVDDGGKVTDDVAKNVGDATNSVPSSINGRNVTKVGNNYYVETPGGQIPLNRYDYATGMERPSVSNSDLQDIVDYNYRQNATVGSGSTADAVRHEISTGQSVGGAKNHSVKAEQQITRLKKWINNNPDASAQDIRTAENMIIDLDDALATQ